MNNSLFIKIFSILFILLIHFLLNIYIENIKIKNKLILDKFSNVFYENNEDEKDSVEETFDNLKNDLLEYVNITYKGNKKFEYFKNKNNSVEANNFFKPEKNIHKFYEINKHNENKHFIDNKKFYKKEQNNKPLQTFKKLEDNKNENIFDNVLAFDNSLDNYCSI